MNKTQYLTLIEEKTFGGIPREIEIEPIDVEGNIAMVKAKLKSEQLTFKSFISLVQLENKDWQVIGNFPHIIPNQ
ncbi:nuclear transport factor 2 family protein [Roseivirga sp.]|uniref:nuclear transport factor 2 family protein n=1 Tax=Roseivirga sp. TaxID=1964215 RepID=UPI003B51CB03